MLDIITLHRAHQIAAAELTARLGDLTHTQAILLAALAAEPGKSQTHYVLATGIDRSTAADVYRRLKNAGFIARKRSADDARSYEMRLTAKGAAAAAAIDKALPAIMAGITARVGGLDQLRIVEARP